MTLSHGAPGLTTKNWSRKEMMLMRAHYAAIGTRIWPRPDYAVASATILRTRARQLAVEICGGDHIVELANRP
jgi:hypothetical protein